MRKMHAHMSTCTARILLAMMMLFTTLPSWGQYRRRGGLAEGDQYHFGYVSGHMGYSMLSMHATGTMPVGSLGGGVGIGYEYRNSGLWANFGLQLSFHRSSLQRDPYTIEHAGAMRDGDLMREGTMFYDVTQRDEISWNFIDVPILFGYYTHGFHVGAGLKISYALNPTSITKGTYNLRFRPNNTEAIIDNLPDRGLKVYDYRSEQANRLNVGVGLIGEIGYDLLSSMPSHSRICHVLKLSFYFEYGLNNYNKGDEKASFELPAPNDKGEAAATGVVFNPYLNTTAGSARCVPFIAGVKITYMIGGSRTARSGFHHGCMCYN